jgi:RNA polymerase sigma-70 factor (ECF subfamily)
MTAFSWDVVRRRRLSFAWMIASYPDWMVYNGIRRSFGMVISNQHEKILIQRASAGEAAAFGELYSIYLDAIYRYVFFRVGEQQDAEDLTEAVFLKAWEALPSYRDFGYPLSSWLYRIAHNIVVDFHRRARPFVQESEAGLTEDRVDESINTLGKVIEAEELNALAKAISQLTVEQQQVIILRFIEGMSHTEISKVIGKNEGTCRMIQHRGLVTLNKLLCNDDRIREDE